MPTNDIGADRFQARLTKELRIKGSMPAPVLAPEIVPVLVVEGERPENLILQRERRYACGLTLGAVAAEFYYFQLNNPAGRNGVVIVEEIGISCANPWDFGYSDDAVTASLGLRASYCLDTRVPWHGPRIGIGNPVIGTDIAAGLINVFGRVNSGAATFVVIKPNVVLTPGHGFSIWVTVLNVMVHGYMIWRERQLEDGELI